MDGNFYPFRRPLLCSLVIHFSFTLQLASMFNQKLSCLKIFQTGIRVVFLHSHCLVLWGTTAANETSIKYVDLCSATYILVTRCHLKNCSVDYLQVDCTIGSETDQFKLPRVFQSISVENNNIRLKSAYKLIEFLIIALTCGALREK